MVLGVRHLVKEVTIVREEDQPFAFSIQPPDRAQHGAAGQFDQVRNQHGGVRIAARRHDPARLVQRDIVVLGRRDNQPAIICNFVFSRLDLRAQLSDRLAVDFHPPVFNPHFTRAAGPDPGLGQPLLQTHGRAGGHSGGACPAGCGTRRHVFVFVFVGQRLGHK